MAKIRAYERLIMEATGCDHERSMVIEDAMRDLSPTRCLDHLDKPAFHRLAREGAEMVQTLEDAGESTYGPF